MHDLRLLVAGGSGGAVQPRQSWPTRVGIGCRAVDAVEARAVGARREQRVCRAVRVAAWRARARLLEPRAQHVDDLDAVARLLRIRERRRLAVHVADGDDLDRAQREPPARRHAPQVHARQQPVVAAARERRLGAHVARAAQHEVAEPVEDRHAVADLDPAHDVRVVADDQIDAVVIRGVAVLG